MALVQGWQQWLWDQDAATVLTLVVVAWFVFAVVVVRAFQVCKAGQRRLEAAGEAAGQGAGGVEQQQEHDLSPEAQYLGHMAAMHELTAADRREPAWARENARRMAESYRRAQEGRL